MYVDVSSAQNQTARLLNVIHWLHYPLSIPVIKCTMIFIVGTTLIRVDVWYR